MATPRKAASAQPTLADSREEVKIVYYGEPGTGKTTDLASLANLGTVHVIDAESGMKKRALSQFNIPLDRIVPYKGEVTFAGLSALFFDLKATLDDDPDSIVGVNFDSQTEIAALLLEQVTDKATAKAANKGKPRETEGAELGDYGVLTDQLRRLTRRFRDLPCHVAWSCLERRNLDTDGALELVPSLPPKYGSDLRGYADIVVRTVVKRTEDTPFEDEYPDGMYLGITRTFGKNRGKDRFKVLPGAMMNPSLDRIVAVVNGDLDMAKDKAQLAYEALRKWEKEQAASA